MVDERKNREHETRDTEARTMTWAPPNILPDPAPQPGYVFRWVRTSVYGEPDMLNASQRFREGWVPCRAEDHPEIAVVAEKDSKFKGMVEFSGLLLCKMPKEMYDQRVAYYDNLARNQLESVERNYMRQNDARMPVTTPERRVVTTFGRERSRFTGDPKDTK